MRQITLGVVEIILIAVMLPGQANACVAISTDIGLRITNEKAVIVWDASHHTEHFIRQATFDTTAKDFGFLVPTPDTPELKEADPSVFDDLGKLTLPETRNVTKIEYDWTLIPGRLRSGFSAASMKIATSTGDEVEVVTTSQVGGMKAVVLRAGDATLLGRWLKRNGYPSTPALTDWLRSYIRGHWLITAFKIAKSGAGQRVSGNLVRMSFRTDRPFYPYSEPPHPMTADEDGRELDVYFLADRRMDGFLGTTSTKWPGQVSWTSTLKDSALGPIATKLHLPAQSLTMQPWMTVFNDYSSPRIASTDVNFKAAANQAPIVPDPIIHEHTVIVPVFYIVFGLLGAAVPLAATVGRRRNPPADTGYQE